MPDYTPYGERYFPRRISGNHILIQRDTLEIAQGGNKNCVDSEWQGVNARQSNDNLQQITEGGDTEFTDFLETENLQWSKLTIKHVAAAVVEVIILKSISPPSLGEFDKLIAEARKKGKQAGIEKTENDEAVSKARGQRK